MPQLPKKREWTDEERKKFSELALGIESPLKHMGELIEANNLALKSFMNPVLNESIRRMAVDFESPLRQLGQSIGKMMSDLAIEQLRESFKTLSTFSYPLDVIDGEVEETVQPPEEKPQLALPATTQVEKVKVLLISRLGIKVFQNGLFMLHRRVIRHLSLRNQPGKLVHLFLSYYPHVITHQQIQDRLGLKDDETYSTALSHILLRVKNIFAENGYKIDIASHRGIGYSLNNIYSITSN